MRSGPGSRSGTSGARGTRRISERGRSCVRYEDLLWRPVETVGAVCSCVGGMTAPPRDFDPILDSYGRGLSRIGNPAAHTRRQVAAVLSVEFGTRSRAVWRRRNFARAIAAARP